MADKGESPPEGCRSAFPDRGAGVGPSKYVSRRLPHEPLQAGSPLTTATGAAASSSNVRTNHPAGNRTPLPNHQARAVQLTQPAIRKGQAPRPGWIAAAGPRHPSTGGIGNRPTGLREGQAPPAHPETDKTVRNEHSIRLDHRRGISDRGTRPHAYQGDGHMHTVDYHGDHCAGAGRSHRPGQRREEHSHHPIPALHNGKAPNHPTEANMAFGLDSPGCRYRDQTPLPKPPGEDLDEEALPSLRRDGPRARARIPHTGGLRQGRRSGRQCKRRDSYRTARNSRCLQRLPDSPPKPKEQRCLRPREK
jgi:hypothetical protein